MFREFLKLVGESLCMDGITYIIYGGNHFAVYVTREISVTCTGMSQEIALLEIYRNPR